MGIGARRRAAAASGGIKRARRAPILFLLLVALPVAAQESTTPIRDSVARLHVSEFTVQAARILELERRLGEVRRVADGTLTDAGVMAAFFMADIWATEHCKARNPECFEANPAGDDSGTQALALKLAAYPVAVGIDYLLRRLGLHGWARAWAGGVVALNAGLTVRSLRIARER